MNLEPNSSHWGVFTAGFDGSDVKVAPHRLDPEPSPLLGNIASSARHRSRVTEPVIARRWLEHGPGPRARLGDDDFVSVGWNTALDLVAAELDRVRADHGNASIFGGSYGWASAGRFHHAQSQLHRFLNSIGGYVRSVNTYSNGAAAVILPHIVGSAEMVLRQGPTWDQIAEHGRLIVAFGGIPTKNTSVTPGGMTKHLTQSHVERARARGVELDLISPLRDDAPPGLPTRWHAANPGTDVAIMLGISHVLCSEGSVDFGFLGRCCIGAHELIDYITGESDGIPKTPEWAAAISGLRADEIIDLAHRMTAGRTLVTVTWSLQRTEHGEQPIWMGVALAALLGQIGLPGGGFAHGLGSMGDTGEPLVARPNPRFRLGTNPVDAFIPVARIADMLLDPGGAFEFDGAHHRYPEISLAYWCGGNPFHHHQDLNRLRNGLGRLDTFIVHDPYWTATARHADIVLPITTNLERDDIGVGRKDTHMTAMKAIMGPFGASRDDYAVFADLADRIGTLAEFTELRSGQEWLVHMYDEWRERLDDPSIIPDFTEFWAAGTIELPPVKPPGVMLAAFRAGPATHPLDTPSGRIELFSANIDSFGYDDCPGHPTWLEPDEYLGSPRAEQFPLHLIANQPATRLHSQHDMGDVSAASKVEGREPIRIHPADAATRGIATGDIVRVFNDRGACLAGACVTDQVMRSVVQLATGAWFEPVDASDPRAMCNHGNPNMVTADRGTSRLAQACTGQHALVEIERWTNDVQPVRAHEPPTITPGPDIVHG